jgi:hypothetical protein
MVRGVGARSATVGLHARLKRGAAWSDRQRTWWAIGACVLVALLLRVPYLSTPLGLDEGGLALIARNWPGGHGSLYGAYWVDRPPLLVGLFKIASLGGAHGVRVLGAVAAVVLVVVIAVLGRAVAGPRAGRIAGLLAALLTGSVSIAAVYTPGELLAAVPSTLAVLCLVLAYRSRQARFVFGAGVLAVAAFLVKQSFLDAGFAGVVFIGASAASDRDVRVRWPLAYVAGGAIPVVAVLVWLAAAHLSLAGFVYTLFGFRLHLLHTFAASNIPWHVRVARLEAPAISSGLLLAAAGAAVGLFRLRRDRVLVITLSAWAAAAVVGVLGGGSYCARYLIELVPVGCVAAAAGIAGARTPIRLAALAGFAAVALIAARGGAERVVRDPPNRAELAVAHYVRAHARPGDTQYVMYARANLAYYTGLPQPYPYLWFLMVIAKPGARAQLQRLLGSSRRPTWLVQWQDDDVARLDPGGSTDRLLARGYRRVAVICGHPILVRNDRPSPSRVPGSVCRSAPGG